MTQDVVLLMKIHSGWGFQSWIFNGETDSEARFSDYVEELCTCLGDADRVTPFRSCCMGLLLPREREGGEKEGGGLALLRY